MIHEPFTYHVLEDMFWAGDGCPGGPPNTQGEYKPKSELAGVRCCTVFNDNLKCDTVGMCPGSATFDQAVCSCRGHIDDEDSNVIYDRLCTKDELKTIVNSKGVCCGSGGQCNNHLVWTSTPYSSNTITDTTGITCGTSKYKELSLFKCYSQF